MRIVRRAALFALSLLVALPLTAQVTVELGKPQGQFLPGEPIFMAVKITNRSGQSLQFGDDNEWLGFNVDAKDNHIVTRLADPEVKGPFTLESGQMATRRVNLTPAFKLSEPGRYAVTASVTIKDWGKTFSTGPADVDIINAINLRELEFGVPAMPGQAPEVRKYALQQVHFEKQMQLYVRVTDSPETHTLRVAALGPMVSFSEPEVQVDRTSNMHVIWQTGARSFAYRMVNPAGEIVGRQTHEFIGTRPKLAVAEDGSISVRGGARRPAADDLPPYVQPDEKPMVVPAPVSTPVPKQ